MPRKSLVATGLVTLSLFAQHFAWAKNVVVERPPQFIAFAFDGSYNNDVWQYSRDYSKFKKNLGIDTRFTFFINPVYLLTPATKSVYKAPGGNRGSAIGWGDDNADVSERIDQMNEAYLEGHEIGSHAVGHFNGSTWSRQDWQSEFSQFDYIVKNLFSINSLGKTKKQHKSLLFLKDIVGFRAPQLGVSDGLFPVLAENGFTYDTSKVDMENYWPKRNAYGTWNFPLAQIKEPGAARRWISMDYNFCVRDSARILSEQPDTLSLTAYDSKRGKTIKNNDKFCLKAITAEQKAKVKKNMMDLYRAYFNNNYYGNRAPMHIGHHFSSWMSGAYLEVFFEFANEVCSKPEVKCGTYADLQKFVESKSNMELNALQAGNFIKLPRPKSATLARHLDLNVSMTQQQDTLVVNLSGRDAKKAGLKKVVSVEGISREVSKDIKLSDIRGLVKQGDDALVRIAVKDRFDKELATATFKVEKVGTANEVVETQNIEEKWLEGHLDGAHAEDEIDTRGH